MISRKKASEINAIRYHHTCIYYILSSSSASSLSLRNIEEHKLSGVKRDRCFRRRYDAVLKALSAATDVAGVTR